MIPLARLLQIVSWHRSTLRMAVGVLAACLFLLPAKTRSQEATGVMSLRDAVETGISANLELKKSRREIEAARANRSVQQTRLLPTLSSTYSYTRNDNDSGGGFAGGFSPTIRDEYGASVGFTQPLFQGFSLINQFKIADLGVDVARLSQMLARLQVIFDIKEAYFNVLKGQRLLEVARDTVKVLEAQVEVARNFYEVGMTPLNDLLQQQVQLANARQGLITAQNNLDTADTQFNIILRRPVNAAVNLVDIQTYEPLTKDLQYFLGLAETNRMDLKVADLQIQIAEKDLQVTRKDYYPTVSLEGNYFRRAEDWALSDNQKFTDPDGWSITGTATWDFWQWGRTSYAETEKRNRLAQARIERQQVIDQARLEVETSYLKAKESEKNIVTVETAIEQAKENMRITEERYKEQVATSVDILVAQNLLTNTQVNFYNALYDFKIAKAFLQKAVNVEVLD